MINLAKLTNVVRKDGKIEARCPACAASGADSTGNHLVVYEDGKFGCVASPGHKEHNKMILRLVGSGAGSPTPQITVRRQIIPASTVLMRIGRVGQQKPTPGGTSGQDQTAAPPAEAAAKVRPKCPKPEVVESFPPPGLWTTIESIPAPGAY